MLMFYIWLLKNVSMTRWPNFFIVGAPRAGTTSLYEYLKQTPSVFMSAKKEPHFFSAIRPPFLRPIVDEKKYLELFKNVKDEIAVGEASTSYLSDHVAPELIHKKIPDSRIIMILRDPVERAFSHYLMARTGLEKRTFHQSLHDYFDKKNFELSKSYVEFGYYSNQIKKYWDVFGKEKVKIIIFEEYIKNVRTKVSEVLRFLEVNEESLNIDNNAIHKYSSPRGEVFKRILGNKTARKLGSRFVNQSENSIFKKLFLTVDEKKPKMEEKDKMLLKRIYRNDSLKTQEILGHSLPWLSLTEKP